MPKAEPQFIIPFAKPSGITSFTSLWQVKHLLGTKKVGHTGTLDSFADGLLVLLSGKLTKLVPYITDFDKTYRVLFYFGKETDTLDPEGTVIAEKPLPVYADFVAAIRELTGTVEQVPPVYSAVKQAGERLSDRIRRGEAITAPPRTVTIYSIDIEEIFYPPQTGMNVENSGADTGAAHFETDTGTEDFGTGTSVENSGTDMSAVHPETDAHAMHQGENAAERVLGAVLRVCCSKGTYIRSLVRDIARQCNSAAYVYALRRTAVGPFTLEQAAGFSALPPFGTAVAHVVHTVGADTTDVASVCTALNCGRGVDGASETVSKPRSVQGRGAGQGRSGRQDRECVLTPATVPYSVTEEELKRAVLPLSEEIARAMHFQTAVLQEKYYAAFMNGKPISGYWFTTPLSEGGTVAVFYDGRCAGLIAKKGNRFHYQTVFNHGR